MPHKRIVPTFLRSIVPLKETIDGFETTTIKKMTPEELAKRRKKGLCFCYKPRHLCKRVFMIQAIYEENDVDVEIETEESNGRYSILS